MQLLHDTEPALLGGAKILPGEIAGYNALGFTGNSYYVKPYSGSDSNNGQSPTQAFKTLAKALATCTAGNNDVVYLIAESNTASKTTDYQSTSLLWNKDLTHLIGVAAPTAIEPRARIGSLSTATGVSPVVTMSANGCYMANVEIYGGITGDATSFGAMKITGSRNYFDSIHFVGMGGSDADTAGAYGVEFNGATECVFNNCTFGNDNVSLDNATQGEIYFAQTAGNASSKIKFINCNFEAWISNAGYEFVTFASTSCIDRWIDFQNCRFVAQSTNDATALTQVFGSMDGFTKGYVNIINSTVFSPGATTAVWIDTGTNRLKVAAGGTPVKVGGEGVIVN